MNPKQEAKLLSKLQARALKFEESIQELWSGYGQINRYVVKGGGIDSIIAKEIDLGQAKDHPRGWNTYASHQRKLRSYEVELNWYSEWEGSCPKSIRTPKCYFIEEGPTEKLLILEDLDAAGFTERLQRVDLDQLKLIIQWLARFHAHFMGQEPRGLWAKGTYWHLERREDEWECMQDGPLKDKAQAISDQLDRAKYRTIIHGDAKPANFCFSEDQDSLAAVDFQYVGGGCGMKDLAYCLSSCLDEAGLKDHHQDLLDYYFEQLKVELKTSDEGFDEAAIETEWRSFYPYAWADLYRFLMGWMPDNYRINDFVKQEIIKSLEGS